MGFFLSGASSRAQKGGKSLSKETLEVLATRGCDSCSMKKEWRMLRTPQMEPTGPKDASVYVLGEAPGEEEDFKAEQFVGKAGRLLRPAMGDLLEVARFNNTINCHPHGNRNPEPLELACCRGYIEDDIVATKPQVLIATGHFPLQWLLGGFGLEDTRVQSWRGMLFPYRIQDHTFWVYPIYHPSWVIRNPGKRGAPEPFNDPNRHVMELDLQRLQDMLQEGLPPVPHIPNKEEAMQGLDWYTCKSNYDVDNVLGWMDELSGEPECGIDLECQGLRPYNVGNDILTVALATAEGGVSFPLYHTEGCYKTNRHGFRRIHKRLREMLYDGPIWIAQNLKFEQEWLSYEFGKDLLRTASWEDTMSMSYAMNHWSSHRLGSLTMRYFGFNVKALSPKMNMSNLAAEKLDRILPYNGLDAKWTAALMYPMLAQLTSPYYVGTQRTYEYQVQSAPTLALAQQEGMCIDEGRRRQLSKKLAKDYERVVAEIAKDKSVKRFEAKYGHTFNPGSNNKDVLDLFRVVLQRPEGKNERTNKYSVDEAALSKMPVKIAKLILEYRNITKIQGTYVDGVVDQLHDDGRLHTNYTNSKVVTGRLSSEDPNNQNWPSRRDAYVRSIIVPPEGYKLVAIDYGQIDARNIAMASGDEAYIEELWKGLDTHQKWTDELLIVAPEKLDEMAEKYTDDKDDEAKLVKWFRKDVKNVWTFPLFYGATLDQAALHLGLKARTIKPVYELFWDTYDGVKKWQEDVKRFYKKYGYIETLNGRRRYGPMKENELINSPIQGTTAEVVGDAMNRCSEAAYPPAGKFRNRRVLHNRSKQPMMQIHDDLTFHMKDDRSFEDRIMDVVRIMCDVPFEWVCVPIVVEVTTGDNWFDMKTFGEFRSDEVLPQ